jgi:DNA replication protein DnaC
VTNHCDAPATCLECAANAKADGGRVLAEWRTMRASWDCDQRFPRRFAAAEPDHHDVMAWVGRYLRDPTTCPSLLIVGPTGTGKTWQAYGALRTAVCTPAAPVWAATTFADFTAALRPSGKDPEGAMDTYRDADMLLLDDLGAAKSSEWVEETTYRLLNRRYEAMLPSIFTTNLPLAELREGLGDRLASRLVEICERVVLTGADRRRQPQSATIAARAEESPA